MEATAFLNGTAAAKKAVAADGAAPATDLPWKSRPGHTSRVELQEGVKGAAIILRWRYKRAHPRRVKLLRDLNLAGMAAHAPR